MELTLKQNDIEKALRTHLQANYGLSLRNKVAVMDFTAGRAKNGLSVLVTIKDADIPGEDGSVSDLIDAVKPAAIVGQNEPKVSATDARIADQANAQPGTVGAALNAAEAAAKPVVEVTEATVSATEAAGDPAPVVVEETEAAVVVNTDAVAVNAEPVGDTAVAAEAEVPAVTTEAAVAAEVKPAAPKTTSGLFS